MVEFGLGCLGANLAARFLGTPGATYVLTNRVDAGFALACLMPVDIPGFEVYTFYALPTDGLRFPYGYDVEADGPV